LARSVTTMSSKKVYALSSGSYSDYMVHALFTTKELAEEARDRSRNCWLPAIEEFDLYDEVPEQNVTYVLIGVVSPLDPLIDNSTMEVFRRFDWEEMSRRTLARHWARRTEEEKREFIELFSKLLERTYLEKVDDYSGEEVIFEGEIIDGDYGVVKTRIVTQKETEIPVLYRVKKKRGEWYVYDISIEGVSLINNYRIQFNSIIVRSSFKSLIKKLKAKVEKK